MNKKRLSVVMAGAMLASSVEPVLAAEETTVTELQKGALITELTNLLWDAPRFASATVGGGLLDAGLANESVYAVEINGVIDDTISSKTVKDTNVKSDLQKEIQTKINALAPGAIVKVIDLGYQEITLADGKKAIVSKAATTKYTEEELINANGVYKELNNLYTVNTSNYNAVIKSYGYEKSEGGFVIHFKDNVDMNADKVKEAKLVLTTDSDRLDFTKYYDKADNRNEKEVSAQALTTDNFGGFLTKAPQNSDITNKISKEFKVAENNTVFALSDLYKAPFLTENGQKLLDDAKEAMIAAPVGNKKDVVEFDGEDTIDAAITNAKADKEGVYKIKVQIADAYKVSEAMGNGTTWTPDAAHYNTYYVTGTSKAELKKVLAWLDNGSADVDVLSGSNRYATAVKIAKEIDLTTLNTTTNQKNDIVLVNGDSLVDGLSAAPLAHKLSSSTKNAPILLTASDELPSATKAYLNELIDTQKNKDITVHVIGGDAVISSSVVKELKSMNLKVERLGGKDRQETSLAVAEKIADLPTGAVSTAYVVGANGEADAMSIAGKAASQNAPIIVSGYKGLSDESLDVLEDKNVTVLGGEAVVSDSDFEAVKSVAKLSRRIAGKNRKATNAAVINTLYSGIGDGANVGASTTKSVIVAKDDELIDALTSANLSAVHNSPIVLGTKSLTEDQLNAVVEGAKYAKKVYQVGGGVAEDVVKAVAEALNLI